ncbi:collagen-like protein [Lysinibacillus sp.]|uniref:collagen-like protein n=1 Tax=Lysinibacillus sp. TaxID=1869345 RepID=UPI0028A01C99|nr:collagen-like protein [Lysinibacillus sp.]
MARMREIGASLDKGYRDDLNYNFGLLEALIGEANGLTDNLREEMLGKINNLQQQIDMLTGENIGELLERLNDSIQQALTAAQEARTAKTATEEATALATTATELANASALLAEEKANYANEKAVLAQEAADNANQEASNLSQLKIDVVQATQDANTATGKANQATQAAQTATDAINVVLPNVTGLVNLKEWSIETQYKKNNFVTLEGNGYMALRDNKGVKPPSFPVLSNADWAMFVQKGEKGEQGTGVRILGTLPDESALPPLGEPGDAYLINGDLYVWSDTTNDWTNVGTIKGPKGDIGPQGPQGEQGPPGQDADLTEVNQEIANLQQTVTNNQQVVTEHLGQSVVSEQGAHKLRYFNDKLEVNIGSVWNKIKTGVEIQDYSTGHLNDLKETGFYFSKGASATRGFPMNDATGDIFIDIFSVGDAITVQTVYWYDNATFKAVNQRVIRNTDIGNWTLLPTVMTNNLNSTSSYEVASAYALKMVNDAKADKAHGGSLTPTGSNGWNTSNITYFKDSFGIVHVNLYALSGSTSTGTIITTLPVDYRPVSNRWFSVTAYNSSFVTKSCSLAVRTNGNIVLDTTGDSVIVGYLSFPTV